VWVKASKLWNPGPHHEYGDNPDGAELDFEVLGLLTGMVLRADGGWLAEVRIVLHSRNGRWHGGPYTQLVPSHLVRWHRVSGRGETGSGLSH
jgi:hypothetical protein